MGIRESLLNTITSVGSSDFVRIVTSAGASSKATLQNVIKSFETGLGAKTSLTTSDYIRVVGSDNNLYKQSVGDTADMMAERYNEIFGSGTTNNANDAKIGVWYRVYTSGENIPAQGVLYTYGAASSKWQQVYTGTEVYTRTFANNAWSEWVKLPTRTEIDAIKNNGFIESNDYTAVDAEVTRIRLAKVGRLRFIYVVFIPSLSSGTICNLGSTDFGTYVSQYATAARDGGSGSCEIGWANGGQLKYYGATSGQMYIGTIITSYVY